VLARSARVPTSGVGKESPGHVASNALPYCQQCASEYDVPARFCGHCGTSLPGAPEAEPDARDDPWIGQIVDRRYRVVSRVGAGGMGMVYKVEHMQLAKVAAMKVLHPEMARDAEAVRRFRTEAQAVSRLDHPNIVQTFDFGQWDEALYLVMEYLKGDDLAIIMKREGPLPFPRAARLFVQICSALTEAHESGVIHRDLKPENIVVIPRRDGTETAKVLDFGLAKLRERTEVSMATSGNQVIGTPYYMSPEQVRSEPLDVRTDIYSLGATFYRVLTGTPPFQATTPVGVLTKHVTDPLEPPRARAPQLNLPPVADAILSRAMAKAREDRYPTAADVKRALEAALAELGAPVGAAGARTSGAARSGAPTFPSRPPEAGAAGPIEEARGTAGTASGSVGRGTGHAPTLQVADPEPPPPAGRFSTGRRFLGRGRAQGDAEGAEEESDEGDLSVEEEAASGADRLRRQEFDAFERGLRRRRLTAVLGVPLVIAGVATLIGLRAYRGRDQAPTSEREPNDSPAEATLLTMDRPIEGQIGKRVAEGTPDLDYYRLPLSKSTRAVSARLSGIPGVDLVLELYDGQGAAIAKSDARGAGGGEWLQPTLVGPGEAYLLVRQLWTQGSPVVEDVPDAYKLSVHFGSPEADWETEPNDTPATATPFQSPARRQRGYLGSPEDRDWYSFASLAPGTYVASVTAPMGVEVVILSAEGPAEGRAQQGRGGREEARSSSGAGPAKVAKQVPAGEREQTKFQVRLGKPTYIGVARKLEGARDPKERDRDAKEARDPKEQSPVGLDEAYEISIEAVRD